MPHCLSALLSHCLTVSLPHCLTALLSHCLTASLPRCLTTSLPRCHTVSLPHCRARAGSRAERLIGHRSTSISVSDRNPLKQIEPQQQTADLLHSAGATTDWFIGQPAVKRWFTGLPNANANDTEIADWFRGQPMIAAATSATADWFRYQPAVKEWFGGQPMPTASDADIARWFRYQPMIADATDNGSSECCLLLHQVCSNLPLPHHQSTCLFPSTSIALITALMQP